MHYEFDHWLENHISDVWFERYADDALIHCRREQEAMSVLEVVRGRLFDCGLTLHPIKTKLVYCKATGRPGQHEHISFDFLGYTFRARTAQSCYGNYFAGFLPAISKASAQHIRDTIKVLGISKRRSQYSLPELAKLLNPYVQGLSLL